MCSLKQYNHTIQNQRKIMKKKYFFICILASTQQSTYCNNFLQENKEENRIKKEELSEELFSRAAATIDVFKEKLINTADMDKNEKKKILDSHDHFIELYNGKIEKLKKEVIKHIQTLENEHEKNTLKSAEEEFVDYGATKIAITNYTRESLNQLHKKRTQKIITLFKQIEKRVLKLHKQLENKIDTYYLQHTAAGIRKKFAVLIKTLQKQ
jgi:hypothetical protein